MPRIWISLLEFRFADLNVRDLSLEIGWWHIQKQSIRNSDLFPHAKMMRVAGGGAPLLSRHVLAFSVQSLRDSRNLGAAETHPETLPFSTLD